MPNPGTIDGTHHLTFCVGGAQEDYDFHVRTLGLKSVKKTVLFDGEIPIYHLYYANRVGDASTILTALPVPPGGLDGQARDQPAAKRSTLAVPAESIGYWADRLSGAGHRDDRGRALRHRAARVRAPVRHPVPLVGETRDRRARALRRRRRAVRARDPRRLRHDDLGPRARADGRVPARGVQRRARRLRGRAPPVPARPATATARCSSSSRSPTSPQGTWHFGEGTIHHHAFDVGTSENQLRGQGLHRRPRLHRRLRRQGPRLLLQRLPAHAGRRAVRARLLDRGGLHDRRGRGRARHAHVHPAALGGPARRDRASSSRSTPSRR